MTSSTFAAVQPTPADRDCRLNVVDATLKPFAALSHRLATEDVDEPLDDLLASAADQARAAAETLIETVPLHDERHTMAEVYDYRMLYNALLFNQWAALGLYDVHKSLRHDDGEECFGGGWFIVKADIPTGQISNHYRVGAWGLFRVPVREVSSVYDGHTPAEAAWRMKAMLQNQPDLQQE